MPQARASKDKLIQEAKGYADRRRLEAQGEISALLAKYEAYRQAPDVTRRRLYIEAMEEVLAESSSKTILDSDLQGPVAHAASGFRRQSHRQPPPKGGAEMRQNNPCVGWPRCRSWGSCWCSCSRR